MYRETHISGAFGALMIGGVFLLIFLPWVLSNQELFRQEALYAAEAAEFNILRPVVTAHHAAIRNGNPLMPALTAWLVRCCSVPVEMALRLISVFFLAAGAVLVYFSTAMGSGRRAGLVSAAMFTSTMLVMEKGIEGTPGSMNAFWLLAAQLFFFYFGLRQGKWNLAWLGSAALLLLGYYSGGFIVLLFFIAPMFFYRRPLAGAAKFRHWGFLIAALLIASTLLGSYLSYWALEKHDVDSVFWWGDFSMGEYVKELLLYWVRLPIRLLPWSFIAWLPFCVALQALDPKPLFSKYLRTQVFVAAGLLWFLPKIEVQENFYLLGNLSILCGIYYDLGTRRYGEKLRPVVRILSVYFGLFAALLIAGGMFISEELLGHFLSLGNTLKFRGSSDFQLAAWCAIGVLTAGSLLLLFRKKELPVWSFLLWSAFAAGTFSSVMLLGYRAQDQRKRTAGAELAKALTENVSDRSNRPVLYKCGIADLYGVLYYTGADIRQADSASELPDGPKEVFLLGTEFPQNPKRQWRNLLPEKYRCFRQELMLWKGVRHAKRAKQEW